MPEAIQPSELHQEIGQLEELVQEWVHLFPQAAPQGEHWQKVLSQVRAHLAENVIRVAVVGTVKSGKSTLINALVGQDVLKRGAGILTAMITRLQSGPKATAVLQFKEWPEITEEIHRALGLLPNARLQEHATPIDVQQDEDRELLAQVLVAGQEEDLWSKGSLNQNFYLLKSYLDGYDLLKEYLAAGHDLFLAGPDLGRHRDLVTQEACAVYLKDALLTVPTPWIPAGLELGDCQGSDSPIPQHLTQVLAYLLKTDLVFYSISSRVGLRQADFQFLAELKRTGLGEHILFLLNLDLTEHRDLAEIEQLREKVGEELSAWIPNPQLATFSALKLLLDRRRSRGEELEPREAGLLELWSADAAAAAFSDDEFFRFNAEFKTRLKLLKTRRLKGGALAQVHMVARGLKEQWELAQGLLNQDLDAFREMEARLKERRQPLEATKGSFKQALEGAGANLKKTLKIRVSSFLDRQSGKGASLPEFIRQYEPDWDQLAPNHPIESLRITIYRLFQELQTEVTRFASSEFNLQVVEFVRDQEAWLNNQLEATCTPLFLSLQEALTLYYQEAANLGLPGTPPHLKPELPMRPAHLDVPLMSLPLESDWRWAGEVWLRSGMGRLGRVWQAVKAKLGWKAVTDPRERLIQDLARALKTIKGWLQEQVRVQLVDFGERLKFQYFLPLVDDFIKKLEGDVDNLMGSLVADLEGVAVALRQEEADREARRRRLMELAPEVRDIEARLAKGPQETV